nr:unnamed protein product [Callosobruchus analis]
MIDKKLGDKPVYFEISIGNAGNAIDGHNESSKDHYDSDSDELESVSCDSASWQSTTTPAKPMTHDKIYYFLPYWDNKPCMHVRSVWADYRRRMYNSNMIAKIADKFEDGLVEVQHAVEKDTSNAEIHLKQVLEDLSASSVKYVSVAKSSRLVLELERPSWIRNISNFEHIGSSAKNLRALVTKSSFKERVKTAQGYLNKLKFLTENPQHAFQTCFCG